MKTYQRRGTRISLILLCLLFIGNVYLLYTLWSASINAFDFLFTLLSICIWIAAIKRFFIDDIAGIDITDHGIILHHLYGDSNPIAGITRMSLVLTTRRWGKGGPMKYLNLKLEYEKGALIIPEINHFENFDAMLQDMQEATGVSVDNLYKT